MSMEQAMQTLQRVSAELPSEPPGAPEVIRRTLVHTCRDGRR